MGRKKPGRRISCGESVRRMCGIVGIVSKQNVAPLLLEGLKRLEYRGYDSAGIAVIHNGAFRCEKVVGRVSQLDAVIDKDFEGTIGIAHTRWATHGAPTLINAHPHFDEKNRIIGTEPEVPGPNTALKRR